jgi:hypothetical protein
MSTDEDEGRKERIVAFRRRREPILLPADPTDEELARDWTLSEADITQVLQCRGDAHRLWFAIQLCVLRRVGRFVDPSHGAPGRIVSHLCGQIGLGPLLFLKPPERPATLLEYERQIRRHLGYQMFDEEAQRRLEAWLYDRAAEGVSTVELFDRAEAILGRWKIELPAPSTLERIASALAVRARQETFSRLSSRLSPPLCQSIDQLLDVRDLQLNRGESRHALARWLFFAQQGEFRTGDYEEIMNKASCLSLLSNAVLVWNTVQMDRIVRGLRAAGQCVSDDDLTRISPLAYAHVIPSGTYHFDRSVYGAHQTGGESI